MKALITLLIVIAFTFAASVPAAAHCDTMQGPVVVAAQGALASGDVTPVLKWVRPEHEAEIRAAFARAMKVRAQGEEARELADRYFFETVVRIHRSGEGEPYTGLKPAGAAVEPGIAAADAALDNGNIDQLATAVSQEIATQIRHRFARVQQARRHAEDSVAAGRAYVAAYVSFIHYVESLHAAANPAEEHGATSLAHKHPQ